jgi:uncharacterized membrane protein
MNLTEVIERASRLMEGIGVAVIVIGAIVAIVRYFIQYRQRVAVDVIYKTIRVGIARPILLGLEFLVAADIIRTVAIEPTLENVGVLAAIVGIRTVLSFSLQLEIEGRWPWQPPQSSGRTV